MVESKAEFNTLPEERMSVRCLRECQALTGNRQKQPSGDPSRRSFCCPACAAAVPSTVICEAHLLDNFQAEVKLQVMTSSRFKLLLPSKILPPPPVFCKFCF